MTEKKRHITSDEAVAREVKPELDDDWFAEADGYVGAKLVQRGRPKSDNPKRPVSLRLDPEVVDWFRNTGTGWQTRINDELRKVAGL